MNPKQLIVRCYSEQEGDCWIAVCLDFNLASQGDSFEEVKSKLETMLAEYVYDALAGEDKRYMRRNYYQGERRFLFGLNTTLLS